MITYTLTLLQGLCLVDRGSYAQKKGKPKIQDVMTEAKRIKKPKYSGLESDTDQI